MCKQVSEFIRIGILRATAAAKHTRDNTTVDRHVRMEKKHRTNQNGLQNKGNNLPNCADGCHHLIWVTSGKYARETGDLGSRFHGWVDGPFSAGPAKCPALLEAGGGWQA